MPFMVVSGYPRPLVRLPMRPNSGPGALAVARNTHRLRTLLALAVVRFHKGPYLVISIVCM
jgi:hypothetical protein